MKRAVTSLKERSSDTTFLCLSNSNEIYISTILEVSSYSAIASMPHADLIETRLVRPLLRDHHEPSALGLGLA